MLDHMGQGVSVDEDDLHCECCSAATAAERRGGFWRALATVTTIAATVAMTLCAGIGAATIFGMLLLSRG